MAKVIDRKSISDELAQQILEKAVEKGKTLEGGIFAIAIVDESGILKAFRRMDPCPIVGVQVSLDKAYSAILKGAPTHQWYQDIKDEPAQLHGVPAAINRLTIFGGGFPIEVDGFVVGGIGVSGGTEQHDMEVARAGLEAI